MARNIIIVIAVLVFVVGVAWYKSARAPTPPSGPAATPDPAAATATPTSQPDDSARPRMVDLGSDQCKACKAMKPILDELRKQYAGRADIEFIDVNKMPVAKQLFGIRTIPTQIFYDGEGEEVWRHEGFLSKEEIEAKLKELGA
jgi:thioredoxin 1